MLIYVYHKSYVYHKLYSPLVIERNREEKEKVICLPRIGVGRGLEGCVSLSSTEGNKDLENT